MHSDTMDAAYIVVFRKTLTHMRNVSYSPLTHTVEIVS